MKKTKTSVKKSEKTPKKISKKVIEKKSSSEIKSTKKNIAKDQVIEKPKKYYSTLRGMHDILPREEKYWKTLYNNTEKMAEYFHFGRIQTPIMEDAKLFIRSLGKGNDVINKEMYVFDISEGKICLRPEITASVVRAYTNAGMWNYPQPVKLWYFDSMFRHDRPQAGRYRQFTQAGFEILGTMDPASDAELILLSFNFFKDINFPVEIRINSIGMPEERERYITELANYYRTKKSYLCEDCRKRLTKNPLRLLDCKEDQCQPIKDEAPQIIDWLSESSKNHFMKVLEYLDELQVPYVLQPTLVRGLDYYTHTVFEIYPSLPDDLEKGETAQSALGGGGRYDLLVEEISGKSVPAAGVAIGIDRTVSLLKTYAEKLSLNLFKSQDNIFFAQLGDRAKGRSLKLLEDLRKSGLKISFNLYKNSLKSQLDLANEIKVPYALILGQKEVQEGTIIIRDMESGIQEIVDQKKVETILKRKLKKFDELSK